MRVRNPAVGTDLRAARRDETNHAFFFSLLMGSSRKNGRLGDPALPSLSSNRSSTVSGILF